MARKGPRQLVGLVCKDCNSQNYITERNRANTEEKLDGIKKFCAKCNKNTEHKARKKLK